jgi:hypothetical protein
LESWFTHHLFQYFMGRLVKRKDHGLFPFLCVYVYTLADKLKRSFDA